MKEIERKIFGFIWVSSKSEIDRAIDRIKRSISKNEFSEGGLNISDVECLNKALTLRQFVRADTLNHPIRRIQLFCLEKLGDRTMLKQINC